ncbi:hypothetical protein [Rhodovastum atsumiense]|nr:hypothetical protein [Rhodovastum atsumiense]
MIAEIQGSNTTLLFDIAAELAARSIPTPSGRGGWHAATVQRILARLVG